MSKRLIMTGLFLSMVLSGCASMPHESVQLSAEIGTRIVESREAHLALIRQYMAEKRARVNDFIAKEWIPEYARQVFQQESVIKEWNRVARTDDSSERLEFITGLSERLQQRINDRREKLLAPIDRLERLMLQRIGNHYDELIAANATLTTFLDSSVKLKERQQKALAFTQADERLTKYMELADELVETIIAVKDGYEVNKERIDKIIESLERE